ncbi:hypothetical protein GY45DRAFT_422935 [Cubamyces sp. BRFM 1775]|nr:hypothetical protein GY45DRAFT_422935 [Cubamyces sp. BRFM 1775]
MTECFLSCGRKARTGTRLLRLKRRTAKVQRNLQWTWSSYTRSCMRDGQYLATGCDRSAQIYDTKTAVGLWHLCIRREPYPGYVRSLGSKVRDGRFWDSDAATTQCILQGHTNSVISVEFSSTNLFATGSGDWAAKIWRYRAL